jgi:hypothetical protein
MDNKTNDEITSLKKDLEEKGEKELKELVKKRKNNHL